MACGGVCACVEPGNSAGNSSIPPLRSAINKVLTANDQHHAADHLERLRPLIGQICREPLVHLELGLLGVPGSTSVSRQSPP